MHQNPKESRSIAVATKRLSFIWVVKKPGTCCITLIVYCETDKPPEQVQWIEGHLKDMCLAAPPGLLHITIFITAKRSSEDAPVLEGFVTDDRRPPLLPPLPLAQGATPSQGAITHNAIVEVRSGRPDFSELIDRELHLTEYGE